MFKPPSDTIENPILLRTGRPAGSPRHTREVIQDVAERGVAGATEPAVGGQPYLPAGGHEEDSLAITERYRIR